MTDNEILGIAAFIGFLIICCIAGFIRWIFRINTIVALLQDIKKRLPEG